MEALFLASPVLYEECRSLVEGDIPDLRGLRKIRQAVLKYYTRMYSRCTPFGLFSGCSVARWSADPTQITIAEDHLRHTRFDMHYLCALAQYLSALPGIKEKLNYTRNSTLYQLGDELRYVEYYYKNGNRTHKISSVLRSEYLDLVLGKASSYQSLDTLADLLKGEETKEDIYAFLYEMIDTQLLVSELEPAITGPEFIHQLLQILGNQEHSDQPEISRLLNFLRQMAKEIETLDSHIINYPDIYKRIRQSLLQLPVEFDAAKLFQCDMSVQLTNDQVSINYQEQLMDALEVVHRLCPVKEHSLDEFMHLFRERYEDRELPLLEVLDTETGIPYRGNTGVELSPLLNDFVFPKPDKPKVLQWGMLEQYLHKKIQEAYVNELEIIEITKEELSDFPSEATRFAPSSSVMFRILDAESSLLFLETASGASAASLLGRFAHGNEKIYAMVKDITAKEQELESGILFAEIIHLPESRMGNILLHPSFRSYEIPYLAKSSVDAAFQIPAQDLLVSVRNNRVLLRSASLNREIIPRLSSAHNYRMQPLPVYEFLCDLQGQGISGGIQFGWGELQGLYTRFPRVQFGQTILHPATWRFRQEDLKELKDAGESDFEVRLKEFRNKWKLPEKIVVADGDNELLIDFSDPLLNAVFYDILLKRPQLLVREFLFNNSTGVVNSVGASYANQLVAVLQKKESTYTHLDLLPTNANTPERFSIGSEWVYFKIYCGSHSADKILTEGIYPLIRALETGGLIKRWFFIRYQDPHFHIRLRFHLNHPEQTGAMVGKFSAAVAGLERQGFIWKIQADTYKRELDRYGSSTIEHVEELFCLNSAATLNWLKSTEGDEREMERWLWGLKKLNELLECFELDLESRHTLLEKLKTSFAEEFHTGKLLRQQLDTKYRAYRKSMEEYLNAQPETGQEIQRMVETVNEILRIKEQNLLEPDLDNLLASIIHMQLNRLFPSKPREHEMICYDLLYRWYHARKMRKK